MTQTLLVYLHGIGDNIMLTGVLKEFARRHPGEAIELVVLNPGCVGIWNGNPLVRAVSVFPFPQPHFWNPAKFYLAHQWKVRRYVRELNHDGRYQRVLFPTIQTLPEIIYHLTGTYGRHKVDRLCADMGVPKKLYPYDLHTTTEDAAEAEKLLQKFSGTRLAVLHPFSGHSKKRISAQGFGKILDILRERGLATLVVGAANEKSKLDPAWKTESVFGLSFGVLIEVLKHAEVFAGTDSTVAHLAAFANTPRLVILSTKLNPERYLPISERSRVFTIRIKQGRENDSLEKFRGALAAEW
jgi:ADP-heptose:LPS heptosyltransferase